MPKEEWGVKRLCPESGKRFYDLNADPVISPYTGSVVTLEVPGAKVRPAEKEKKATPEAETEEEAVIDLEDDVDVLAEDDDSDVNLGDDILDDDDDDTVDLEEIADVPADDTES